MDKAIFSLRSLTAQFDSLVSMIALFSCITYSQGVDTSMEADVRGVHEFRFKIHPSLPSYIFRLIGDDEFDVIKEIRISAVNDTSTTQILNDFLIDQPPFKSDEYFTTEDANFDGYQDIKLLNWYGVTGNTNYLYWLYDPSNSKFVFSKMLSAFFDPEVDTAEQVIRTHSNGAGEEYGKEIWKYLHGQLTLIRSEEETQTGSTNCFFYYLHTIQVLKDGMFQDSLREEIINTLQ